MRMNFLVILVVSSVTSLVWSAPLVMPTICFPCAVTANQLRSRKTNSLDPMMAIAASADMSNSIAKEYLVDVAAIRQQAQEVARAAFKPADEDVVRCRHARAAEARGDGQNIKIKRRVAPASDLSLCVFKICNIGRKRNSRFVHANSVVHEE